MEPAREDELGDRGRGLRTLFVLDYSHLRGGMMQAVELMVRHLVPRGVACGVVLPREGEASAAFRAAGAQIWVGRSEWALNKRRPMVTGLTLASFSRLFRRAIVEFQPTVIETNHITSEVLTAVAGRLIGVRLPRLFVQRGNIYWYRGISLAMLRWALRTCAAVVFKASFGLADAPAILGVRPGLIRVIPDATDLHCQPPGGRQLRTKLGVPEGAALFAQVGFVGPGKDQETFLEVARLSREELPDARFAIFGEPRPADAGYLQMLKAKVAAGRLEDRVSFAGHVHDKRSIMYAADVVVSTSLHEGFGLTLIEAWACGKPVIATRCGGPECIVQDGVNGFLIACRDAAALGERVIRLGRDAELRRTMGEAGRAEVLRRYDAGVVADQQIALYREIARDQRGRNRRSARFFQCL